MLVLAAAAALSAAPSGLGPALLDASVQAGSVGARSDGLTALAVVVTNIGSPVAMAVLAAVVGGWCLYRGRWADAVLAVGAMASAGVWFRALKVLLDRPRPPSVDRLVQETNEALPSGHATMSIVVVGTLVVLARADRGRVARIAIVAVAAVWVGAVGATRIYLGVHWFSDVIAGWLVGAAWLAVCVALWSWWRGSWWRPSLRSAAAVPEGGRMDEQLWQSVDDYWNGLLLAEDPVLDAALQENAAAGLPAIDVSRAQGKLLHLMARSIGARRVLEVGTLGGYSTIWLARALPADGLLVTCEIDPHHAEVARANLARAGLGALVDVRVGPALDTLADLDGPFDLAFVDADKASNTEYFQQALRLSRPGAMIIVDNVVRGGAVVDAASSNATVVSTRRFGEMLAAEDRVDATVIQTVGAKGHDGFVLAVVR